MEGSQIHKQVIHVILRGVDMYFNHVMEGLHLPLCTGILYSMPSPLERTTQQIMPMTQELLHLHCWVSEAA